ncbi:MAG: hypothetical protein JWR72_3906 [Flavisolibacter sp.]|nr:hypothetical protein [Flavisolibacter sp.]
MKKVLFALELFSIIALFFSYLVLEITHEPGKQTTPIFHPTVTVEKSTIARPLAAKFKERNLIPFPLKLIAAFIRIPS